MIGNISKYRVKITAVLSAALLSSCVNFNISPPEENTNRVCNFKIHTLSVNDPHMDQEIRDSLNKHIYSPLLYLSGGSQNGAFGAGYLNGWAAKNKGKLPEFALVTGVSTGAILSLSAFANVPEAAMDGYQIDSESNVLDVFVKNKNGKLSLFDYITAAQKGALADLGPMKKETKAIIEKYGLIKKISDRADAQRKLFIGVVDVDTGYAMAFDMTHMAQKIQAATLTGNGAQQENLTNCFVDAVAASSAAPLAARPVFIDNKMYIDGGARFGIFSDRIGSQIKKQVYINGVETVEIKRKIYVIINGDQKISSGCKICGTTDDGTAHKDWNLLDLAFRSISILSDQVYQFSEFKAVADGNRPDANYKILKTLITDDKDTHMWAGKNCAAWIVEDKKQADILEFHPNYMKCLIDYGRKKAVKEQWANGPIPVLARPIR